MQMGSINTECAQWSHAEEHTSLLPLASFLISSTLGNQRDQSLLSKCHLKRIGAGEFTNFNNGDFISSEAAGKTPGLDGALQGQTQLPRQDD